MFLFVKRYHIVYPLGKRIPGLPVEQLHRPGVVKKKVLRKIGDVADRVEADSEKSGDEIKYQLVAPEEADFDLDRISIKSPVGAGLLGKAKGDKVKIKVPAGELNYEILDVLKPE